MHMHISSYTIYHCKGCNVSFHITSRCEKAVLSSCDTSHLPRSFLVTNIFIQKTYVAKWIFKIGLDIKNIKK